MWHATGVRVRNLSITLDRLIAASRGKGGASHLKAAGRKAAATRHSCASLPTGLPHGVHSAGMRFDRCEAYMRSELSGCALPADFAVKVICYGYGGFPDEV